MSAASSAHSSVDRPHTDSNAAALLRALLNHAEQHAADLQAEHDQLLADPDAIQEDRDAIAALRDHALRQLHAARAAMARVDDGTYGTCARCGGRIDDERLAALIDVTTCVQCAA